VQAIVEFQRSLSGKKGSDSLYSTRFLDCCAEVAIAHLLLEQAMIAQDKMRKLEMIMLIVLFIRKYSRHNTMFETS